MTETFRIIQYDNSKFLGEIRQTTQPTKKAIKALFIADDRINEILVQKAVNREERIKGILCSEICVLHILSRFGQLIFLGYDC